MMESALELTAGTLSSGVDASILDTSTLDASQVVSEQIATSEWLGPLAPIALSPFFGLAVLSGAASYGPDWLQERSALLGDNNILSNPLLFWVLLGLAIVTSLPRLTKVSKPIALAAENLESYSAVIILVVVRLLGASGDPIGAEGESVAAAPIVFSAGFADLSMDVLMALVAALNVIVINVVKLCFEFLVWLIPFPAIDAVLEAANKAACGALMGLYFLSPAFATSVNLLLFAASLLVFGWTYRRLRYYREIVAGPWLAWAWPAWFRQRGNAIRAFCDASVEGLPKYHPVVITKTSGGDYEVHGRWWWRSFTWKRRSAEAAVGTGLLTNTLTFTKPDGDAHSFSHRRWVAGDDWFEAVPADLQTLKSVEGNAV